MFHASGPTCPDCGCRDSRIFREPVPGSWWNTGSALCNHCGKVFSFRHGAEKEKVEEGKQDPERAVLRKRLRCPRCGSIRVKTHTTRPQRTPEGEVDREGRRTRFHWCLDCKAKGVPKEKYNFKSIEE